MQVVAGGRYAGPKPGRSGAKTRTPWGQNQDAVGPTSTLLEWDKDENHHQAQLDICMQFGPNPPGSLGAGIRQTDSRRHRQTSSFIYIRYITVIKLLTQRYRNASVRVALQIKKLCTEARDKDARGANSNVGECLKRQLQKGRITDDRCRKVSHLPLLPSTVGHSQVFMADWLRAWVTLATMKPWRHQVVSSIPDRGTIGG